MNRKWYEDNKGTLTNQVQKVSVYKIDPGFTNAKNYSVSQMRTSGADSAHVADLKAKILANGQDIPVSLEKIKGQRDKHDYRLIDGNHRYSAIREINEELKEAGEPELLIKVVVHMGLTTRRRKELQIIWNNHEPALRSTLQDEVSQFVDLINNHNIIDNILDDDSVSDNDKVNAVKDYIIDIGCAHKQPRTVAKKVFEGLPKVQPRIKSYTPVEAVRKWNEKHGLVDDGTGDSLEWKLKRPIQAGYSVYFVDADGHTARHHGQQLEAIANPENNGKISKKIMVAWMKDATGKSPDDVAKFRDRVEMLVKRVNHERHNDGARSLLWDELYFLPQIVSGVGYEQESELIRRSVFNKKVIQKVVDKAM